MSTVTGGDLHGVRAALAGLIPVVRTDSPRSKLVLIEPSAEEKAREAQRRADEAARHAEFAARLKEVEAVNHREDHTICLPNITSLTVDVARKVKGFVEVRIQNGEDIGRTVSGGYDQQEVNSLSSYLSLITDYINGKSSAAATNQPDATVPTTGVPDHGTPVPAPNTSASDTPASATAATGADPNWTDPVGKPGQNHIFFPNVASLTSETAAAVYKQVSSLVQSTDISDSVIHARSGDAGTSSIDIYMSWLAQRASTSVEV